MHITKIQESLREAIKCAINNIALKTLPEKPLPVTEIILEIPKEPKYGDLTTNIAMRLAGFFSLNSAKLADLIKDEIADTPAFNGLKGTVGRLEVSAPGFINFWFRNEYLYDVLSEVHKRKNKFGENSLGKGEPVNIEFVSANPTGPLTVAHGRQAAIGDALARILGFSGYKVCREFFINDAGVQIELLARSIHARYRELLGTSSVFPEDGYQGEYIKDIAKKLSEKYGKKFIEGNPQNISSVSRFGVEFIMNTIKSDLKAFGVIFDNWFSQKTLSEKEIKGVLDKFRDEGYVYDKESAVWFKSTLFGDDKDRVVVKTDGNFTYLAPDIAYHLDKYKRGFKKLIDIWGPDHHGYIPRITAAIQALGYKRESISVLIAQLATLYRNGTVLSMSTRKGEFITLREVMDEVGTDVTKFFFLMRKLDSHLDFDLEVAKKNSMENPVYYIQYAHARITSIFGFAKEHAASLAKAKYDAGLLREPEEICIMRMLGQFPTVVEAAAQTLEPYRLIEYLSELAKIFHSFYTKHRVVSDKDLPLTKARLELVSGVKTVLANGLGLLGISLPERM